MVIKVFLPELFSIPKNGNMICNEIIVIKNPMATLAKLSINVCFLVCIVHEPNL